MKTFPKTDLTTAEDISLVSINMGRTICQTVGTASAEQGLPAFQYHIAGPTFRDLEFFGVPGNPFLEHLHAEVYQPDMLL